MWGRAQHEAAGALISDGIDNFGVEFRYTDDATWPQRSCSSLHSTHSVDHGWVKMSLYNFVVNGPKFTNFFELRRDRG